MSRNVIYIYSDYCPRFDQNRSIRVTYAEINLIGQFKPGYKKISYSCEYSDDCPHLDEYGRCPVCLSSPDEPR